MNLDILWLGEPSCCDRARVGGKAANLSRLAVDFRVPPGFCLAGLAFNDAVVGDRVQEPEAVNNLLTALLELIAPAYRRLAERCSGAGSGVAVRSSAIEEDSATASFAGQHASYLNLTGTRGDSRGRPALLGLGALAAGTRLSPPAPPACRAGSVRRAGSAIHPGGSLSRGL